MSAGRRSLLGRVVTQIGVAFVLVELVVLAVFTAFYWRSLVEGREDHLARYATEVRAPLLAAFEQPAGDDSLDQELEEALRDGSGKGEQRPRFIPPTGAPVRVTLFTSQGARRFTRDGELVDSQETNWPEASWPQSVAQVLTGKDVAGSMTTTFEGISRVEPVVAGGEPAAILVEASLRDVNERVATYGLAAFTTGGVALLFAALVTMNFLRRDLLLPLSRIIEADNAARRGDKENAVVDPGDIPDDEVGAIMRSRNHLLRAMLQAQSELDGKNTQLEQQREELRDWGRDLERLVQDKTAALLRARGILHRTEKLAALGRLSANVAHEINNPLACIAGYAEEAREELTSAGGNPEAIQSLKTIEEQAFRCKDILKRLLGLARADEHDPQVLSFGKLVRETCTLAESTLSKRDVELGVNVEGDGPAILSDPGSLQQLILNLLENAADAASLGEGAPWVDVTVGVTADEVTLTVQDSGRGIPDSIKERVFDPFYTTKPVGRGTGLGLAICQSLVERLGGSISVESRAGQGAAFTVLLPREPEEAEEAPKRPSADSSDLIEAQLRLASASADPDAGAHAGA